MNTFILWSTNIKLRFILITFHPLLTQTKLQVNMYSVCVSVLTYIKKVPYF